MLNKIWPWFLVSSITFAIFLGDIEKLNLAIFQGTEDAVSISMTMLGTMCLWNGLIKIATRTSILRKIKKILKPMLKVLFPEIRGKEEIEEKISMNIVANIMGLGNAATSIGLEAMKMLQDENKDKKKLSNSMAMLIVLNTASLQIIPTTVIAIRNSLGAEKITNILLPIWIATLCAVLTVIFISKILMKKY